MKKIRRRKRHVFNFVLTFCMTFAGVIIVGAAGILIYDAVSDKDIEVLPTESTEVVSREFPEQIPEKVMEETETTEVTPGRYGEVLADKEYMKEHNIYKKEIYFQIQRSVK